MADGIFYEEVITLFVHEQRTVAVVENPLSVCGQ